MGDMKFIGQGVKRREDYRFLTGSGNYTDDVDLPHQSYATFVRSPHAHAKIKGINKNRALKAPGVIAIYTGEDIAAAKINGLPCGWLITGSDGQPMKEPPHPVLAQGKARYVGDHVAMVIAETQHQARDAAELVEVDYEVLPAVVRAEDARKKGAPQVHDELAPDNTCYVWGLGDKAAVDKAFATAAHVTKLEFVNNRLIPNAIEPRAANAVYSRADESYTLYVSSQNPHVERLLMTAFVLGLPEHKVRVVAPQDEATVLAFGYDAWGQGASLAEFIASYAQDRNHIRGVRYLFELPGGEIVANLNTLRFARGLIGIASLSVHLEHRRRGYGTTLVRAVMELLRLEDPQVRFMLFSEVDPKIYEKLGFNRLSSEVQLHLPSVAMATGSEPLREQDLLFLKEYF